MSFFKVIIVGGGLSGALLANGLLNNSVDFMMYERDEANSKREGYQIRLGDAAQAGFRACLTEQQIEAIKNKLGKSTSQTTTAPSLYTSQFKELIDFTSVPSYAKSAGINRVVLRDLLLSWITPHDRIQYKKAFVDYELVTEDNAERVKVNFQDGSFAFCDVLIGADGSHSKINKQLGLNNIKCLESHWSFVSKGRLPYKRMIELPAKLQKGPIILFLNRTALYYALYLPEGASNAGGSSGTGELQYDEDAASFYWAINIPVDELPFKDSSEVKGDKLQVVLDHTKNWAPEFRRMLTIGQHDPETSELHMLKFYASEKPKANWRKSLQKSGDPLKGNPRVWLMGDAVHAMQPTRGQGGNQALNDCADVLSRLLQLDSISKERKAYPTVAEISAACETYEAAMIPRAFEWVKKSGGTELPKLNFDGWLGVIVRLVAAVVVPVLQFFSGSKGKA